MTGLTVGHDEGRAAFTEAAQAFHAAAAGLDERDLLAYTRCRGWAVVDAVVHVRTGLEEVLRGFVAPCNDEPTVDAASYWSAQSPPSTADRLPDEVEAITFTRRLGSAYRRPASAVGHLADAVDAVVGAAERARPSRVRFQGHVLTTGDFLVSWAVELAIHQLDLDAEVRVPPPPLAALRWSRATVEALLGAPVPASLDDATTVLLATGRTRPDAGQAAALGPLADRLPVLA